MRTLISGALVIDPRAGREQVLDILINGNQIEAVDAAGSVARREGDRIIEGDGLWVAPGLIDMHVHLREPGGEEAETIASGCKAAVAGGFTAVAAMANTSPVNDSPELTRYIRHQSQAAGFARVLPVGAASIGLKGERLAPVEELKAAGACAFSDDGIPLRRAELMRKALERSRVLDLVVISHAEDPDLGFNGVMNDGETARQLGLPGIPAEAEVRMVARDIELAAQTGGYLHIAHLSTARALELVRQAKERGLPVTAEVTPHHFLLTEDAVATHGALAKMRPPLRCPEDVAALEDGLKDETVDAIASDHAPHSHPAKARGLLAAPFGVIGLETTLPLTLSLVRRGVISRMRAIELLTVGPARALRLPLPGIAPGGEATLTIIDPQAKWVFKARESFSLSSNSPFDGWRMVGRACAVVIGGKIIHASERGVT